MNCFYFYIVYYHTVIKKINWGYLTFKFTNITVQMIGLAFEKSFVFWRQIEAYS